MSAAEHLSDGQFSLTTKDYEGRVGDPSHMTRKQQGWVPTSFVANMPGERGEEPGAHRNKQGEKWETFKNDIATRGIQEPLHINVDVGKPVRLYEGNHRRDAAVELGQSHVPITIQYFGHAERFHDDIFRDRR
jgi:hypothetical protein